MKIETLGDAILSIVGLLALAIMIVLAVGYFVHHGPRKACEERGGRYVITSPYVGNCFNPEMLK